MLNCFDSGDPSSGGTAEKLLPLVYDELRRLAAAKMANEPSGHTLQPTALVHEVWLKLRGTQAAWNDPQHFFCTAAEAMRRILVDRARRKARRKHGGNWRRTDVDDIDLAESMPPEEILALDEALGELMEVDPEAVRLINLRFFVGVTQAEAAECMGISRSSADRSWTFARAWLFKRLRTPERA